MDIKRGDIFFADLNPVVGAEQAGMHPVLVVQNDVANSFIATITVVPLTSNLRAGRFLFTVRIRATESGMNKDSVALVFQIRTLDKSRLVQKVGHLSDDTMDAIERALEAHFDL